MLCKGESSSLYDTMTVYQGSLTLLFGFTGCVYGRERERESSEYVSEDMI